MRNRLLPLLMLISLAAGSAPSMRTLHSPEPSPVAPDTPESEIGVVVEPTKLATTQVTSPEPRPPAVEDISTPTPAETARFDLARRLNADVELVKVDEVTTRTPDPDEMVCLTDGSIPEALWIQADTVQWVALSVKGNVHHYVALGDLVVYCEE